MTQRIVIDSDNSSPQELKQALEGEVHNAEFKLEVPAGGDIRIIETAVLVAIVSGAFSLLAALLKRGAKQGASTISVSGRSGWKVCIPADTPPERIRQYIDEAKEQEIELVEL
jgi:hypothetical protein